MRIMIYSPHFHPRVGGLENIVRGLAEGFHESGHEVVVVCTTEEGAEAEPFDFRVVRKPSRRELRAEVLATDVVLHACVNLRGLWPVLLSRKPLAITHQVYLSHPVPRPSISSRIVREIKRLSTHRAFVNIACSECLAQHVGRHCVAVPNFYDEATFRPLDGIERDGDLVFLGRLVSDKGSDLAIEALRLLKTESAMSPCLTLIGDGPEREALERQAREAGVGEQVKFVGVLKGDDLARELHRHRIMVVPSRWPEPFGIVALEGIACGLAVLGTRGGGLAEAIGPCGLAVENGSAAALASGIRTLMSDRAKLQSFLDAGPSHLSRHTRRHATAEYLRLISPGGHRPLP